MSELATTLREAIAALAASDRSLTRFGASVHRYLLEPPRASADPSLPDDVRELVTTFASGGAGPFYGFAIPAAAPYELAGKRAIPIGHMGCGYAASLVDGAVWIDARAVGAVRPIYPSFTAYYLDWIDHLAHGRLPDAFVPPGACSMAIGLGGFLGHHEQRLGLAPGTIAGEALRDALAELRSMSIAAQQSPLFADGTRVPPCLACAKLLANLGLPASVVEA